MSDVPLRGFQGAVLKLLRASDYQLTVTGCRELSPHYLRLSFDAGGLLTDRPLHPTMWIRMWFADGDKLHQHGYTLVDPNPKADTVDIEFALHDGVASRWAQDARSDDDPARVFLEAGHDEDKQLPVARSTDVVWVDRKNGGEALVQAVSSSAFDAADHFGWVACDNRITRAVAKIFREEYSIPRKSIKAQAYWVA
jgi:NADPH-dependent ferric siderophore reductase